jgi:hypothetical protein
MKGAKTPGSGRKKGAKNKKTLLREQMIEAITSTTTPLEFLLGLVRADDTLVDLKTKVDAAKAALPYCHVRAGEAVSSDDLKLVEHYTADTDPLLIPRSIPRQHDS